MERSLAEVVRALAGGTMSRRQALAWIGATLAGAVLGRPGAASAAPKPDKPSAGLPTQHGAPLRGMDIVKKGRSLEGRFGLMFKKLRAFECPDELLTKLAADMKAASTNEPSDALSNFPAGFVFLGQFIDHDLTFDTTPLTAQRQDPHALTNFRAARLELDSVYGAGPSQDPQFYNPNDPAKLYITPNIRGIDDLPRGNDGKAIIGDPRDDENLVTSQLHLAFRRFHNALVDRVRAQDTPPPPDKVFEEAQRLCRWHYQWMVIHDFLPKIIGQEVVNELLQKLLGGPTKAELDFYKPKNPNKPMMPIEFAVAAYRFGHSMLPEKYAINEEATEVTLFKDDPSDNNLNGSRPIPPNLVIDWRRFFDIPVVSDPPPTNPPRTNEAMPIDHKLAVSLFELPKTIVPRPDPPGPPVVVSLAERNLLRGKMLGLSSGQEVAKAMGVQALSNEQLSNMHIKLDDPGWGGQAPLWFYILKEAELQGGDQLGAVGGRIVAEVFLGLLMLDRDSYLSRNPNFVPRSPIAHTDGQFGIGDLLTVESRLG